MMKLIKLQFLASFGDLGLLAMRISLGIVFLVHGTPKMMDGPAAWTRLGGAMAMLGVDFMPMFWGFMGAFSEFAGAILMILGYMFRPAMILLSITMFVAMMFHINKGDPFTIYSNAMHMLCVFVPLILIGPGKYSIDRY